MLKFSPGGAVTVRDRPHKVYEVEYEVGVAESEKRVAAIFLLPVSELYFRATYLDLVHPVFL